MVGENDVFTIGEVGIMGDRWVKIKQHRQVHLLMRVNQLILKAEALNLIEIHGQLLRKDLINSDASYRFIRPIIHFVEG